MEFDFEGVYQALDKEELFEIISQPDNYQPEAIEAAWKVASNRRWKGEFDERFRALRSQQEVNELEELNYNIKLGKMMADDCTVEVSMSESYEFEGALINNGIDYCCVEKYGVKSPKRIFYFFKEDFDRAQRME